MPLGKTENERRGTFSAPLNARPAKNDRRQLHENVYHFPSGGSLSHGPVWCTPTKAGRQNSQWNSAGGVPRVVLARRSLETPERKRASGRELPENGDTESLRNTWTARRCFGGCTLSWGHASFEETDVAATCAPVFGQTIAINNFTCDSIDYSDCELNELWTPWRTMSRQSRDEYFRLSLRELRIIYFLEMWIKYFCIIERLALGKLGVKWNVVFLMNDWECSCIDYNYVFLSFLFFLREILFI